MLLEIWRALDGDEAWARALHFHGEGNLPSIFAVTDLAAASVGAAALAAAELVGDATGRSPQVRVDRRLASLWFAGSLQPEGWELPPAWDPLADDYEARDGWIRLHTNAARHRAAALRVLVASPDKEAVAAAVAGWRTSYLEEAIIAEGGCAAVMQSQAEWAIHPQGRAVAAEPLIWWRRRDRAGRLDKTIYPTRPLSGIRVLDLTRVLAGRVATRTLAALGAEVLRIDPPDWDEPALAAEVNVGKRCARLDLRSAAGREQFLELLTGADILIHGLRPGALEALGLGAETRLRVRPDLVDVSLSAYGWSGPWAGRRGFDSLVQMSSGLAQAAMAGSLDRRPRSLPVQALDHATGYIMAAAAIRGLLERRRKARGVEARTSLARTALLLSAHRRPPSAPALDGLRPGDFEEVPEITSWGPARRLRPPCEVEGLRFCWERPAAPLGSACPFWLDHGSSGSDLSRPVLSNR